MVGAPLSPVNRNACCVSRSSAGSSPARNPARRPATIGGAEAYGVVSVAAARPNWSLVPSSVKRYWNGIVSAIG